MQTVDTEDMGGQIHLAQYAEKWFCLYIDPTGHLERVSMLAEFEGEDAEKQAREWVKSYHENRREIVTSEGW